MVCYKRSSCVPLIEASPASASALNRLSPSGSRARLSQSGSKSRLALAGDGGVRGLAGKDRGSRSPSPKAPANSEAAQLAVWHLAPLKACLKRRSPRELQSVLRTVCGERYLQMVSRLRRCKNDPVKRRTACEISVASQLVQARTLLKDWQLALRDIGEARRQRDPVALKELLDRWAFAEDEPEVQDAQRDLARWAQVYAENSPRLVDSKSAAAALKDLNRRGPLNVDGMANAMQMVSRYHDQERGLQVAISSRYSRALAQAVHAWEFETDHKDLVEARALLIDHRDSVENFHRLAVLAENSDAADVEGVEALRAAVDAWCFASDLDIRAARSELLKVEKMHAAALAEAAAVAAAEAAAAQAADAEALATLVVQREAEASAAEAAEAAALAALAVHREAEASAAEAAEAEALASLAAQREAVVQPMMNDMGMPALPSSYQDVDTSDSWSLASEARSYSRADSVGGYITRYMEDMELSEGSSAVPAARSQDLNYEFHPERSIASSRDSVDEYICNLISPG